MGIHEDTRRRRDRWQGAHLNFFSIGDVGIVGFGERKNRSAENMNRGIFRINGVARVNLTALFTAMSHNLRAIRRDNEIRNTHSPEHPLFIPVGDTHTVAIPADLDTTAVADAGANHPKSSQGRDSA